MLTIKTGELSRSGKVSAFDLDGTLIPSVRDEYQELTLTRPTIRAMQREVDAGNDIVIFSNQSRPPKDLEARARKILNLFPFPVWAYFSVKDDSTRKPATGMWDRFVQEYGCAEIVATYIGDAGGRPAQAGRSADFSDSDLKFAKNIGISFCHASDYFLKRRKIRLNNAQVVLMVGFPASGKSTIAKSLDGYTVIGNDICGNISKTKKELRLLLDDGHKVVVDNTNVTVANREEILDITKGFKTVVIWVSTGLITCLGRNESRGSDKVSKIALFTSRKRFEPPQIQEGYDIVNVVF